MTVMKDFMYRLQSQREEAVQLSVNHVCHMLEIFRVVAELAFVAVDDNHLSFVRAYPFVVAVVQARKIVDAYGLLVVSAALFDLRDEVWYARLYVYHEVWQLDERHHEVKEVGVVGKVPVAHVSLRMEVRRKDARILKYRAVLDDGLFALRDFNNFLETLVQEIYLQVERPPLHVMIEIFKIRVVVHRFETRNPIVSFCQHLGERRLSAPDIA